MLCQQGQQTVFPFPGLAADSQISMRMGTGATFVFPVGMDTCRCDEHPEAAAVGHVHAVCNQALILSRHVEALKRVFLVSNIYAHPLIGNEDILMGHRIVSFAGAPIRDRQGRIIGSVCTVDSRIRDWGDTEIRALKETATQIEECQLW